MLCSDRCVARLACTRVSCTHRRLHQTLLSPARSPARVPPVCQNTCVLSVNCVCTPVLPRARQYLCEDNPEYASQVGQHAHDGALQDLSPEAFARRMVCVYNHLPSPPSPLGV